MIFFVLTWWIINEFEKNQSKLEVNTCSWRDARENACEPVTVGLGLELFSIECRKTKTKVITAANHKAQRQSNEPIKTRRYYMRWRKARENAWERVTFGFSFTSDWMKSGARFLSQSCGVVDAKPISLRHSLHFLLIFQYFISYDVFFFHFSGQNKTKFSWLVVDSRLARDSRLTWVAVGSCNATTQ